MLEISGLTWAVTIGVIVALLALDLVLAAARPHRVGFREATAWSVFYIAVAIAFGVWFAMAYGGDFGTEYFAGYIVEKSLSVDNLFVFVIIMTHVRGAGGAPAQGADLRHHARAGPAGDLHRARRRRCCRCSRSCSCCSGCC